LFELLYKSDEPMLSPPDMTKFSSVISMAPLSIWIHLNLKLLSVNHSSQDAAATGQSLKSPKTIVLPDILRGHYNLIIECMNMQNFSDFRSSICMNAC
jgi:hypothetical protein